MKKVSRIQIDEVVSLIKEVQKLTGKKVLFKEGKSNVHDFGIIIMAIANIKTFLDKLAVNPELKYGRTIYHNLDTIESLCKHKINKAKAIGESKKLVKETSGEAEGNKIVDELQMFIHAFSELQSHLKILELKVFKGSPNKNLSRAISIVNILQNKVNKLIQEETQHSDDSNQPIEEDVDMDIDQIMQEPDVVQKLNQKKLNINLVDKNNRNTSSNSSSTSTTTTY